jgi:drug/metabolite transporter (DMT)-like permease
MKAHTHSDSQSPQGQVIHGEDQHTTTSAAPQDATMPIIFAGAAFLLGGCAFTCMCCYLLLLFVSTPPFCLSSPLTSLPHTSPCYVMIFCTSVSQQVATYAGAANPATFLAVLPYFVGGMSLQLFPRSNKCGFISLCKRMNRDTLRIAFVDLCVVTFATLGLSFAGSGIAMVVQSSSVVWSALFNTFLNGAKLSTRQWAGILMVFFGLGISGYGAQGNYDEKPLVALTNAGGADPETATGSSPDGRFGLEPAQVRMIGLCCALCAALASATEGLLINRLLSSSQQKPIIENGVELASVPTQHDEHDTDCEAQPINKPEALSPIELAVMTGTVNTVCVSIYIVLVVLPQWEALVMNALVAPPSYVLGIYVTAAVACTYLQRGYFNLLQLTHGVVAALVLAGRAIIVFALSAVFFCGIEPSQCLSQAKMGSIGVVMSGLGLYAMSTIAAAK